MDGRQFRPWCVQPLQYSSGTLNLAGHAIEVLEQSLVFQQMRSDFDSHAQLLQAGCVNVGTGPFELVRRALHLCSVVYARVHLGEHAGRTGTECIGQLASEFAVATDDLCPAMQVDGRCPGSFHVGRRHHRRGRPLIAERFILGVEMLFQHFA